MGTSKSILELEQELIEVPLFFKGFKTYFYTEERRLIALDDITAGVEGYGKLINRNRLNGWCNTRYLKKVFGEKDSRVIKKALGSLRTGDSIGKLIALITNGPKITWKPVKTNCFTQGMQLELIGKVLLEQRGKAYGFNYEGKYDCLGECDYMEEEAKIDEELVCYFLKVSVNRSLSVRMATKVVKELQIGDSIKVFDENIVREKEERKEQYKENHRVDSIDRFITKIENPSFERATGNFKKGTFDFIRVDVGIITEWHENRWEYIQKNKREITRRVVEKIEKSKRFQAMGVPINFLKIANITLTRDSILEYVFELKIKE